MKDNNNIWEILKRTDDQEKKNKYILETMRKLPLCNIYQIAKILNIDTTSVSTAQHEWLKTILQRGSGLWELKGFGRSGEL